MIKRIVIAVMIAVFVIISGCSKENAPEFKKLTKSELQTKAQKESYVYGIDLAKNLEKSKDSFDSDAFLNGFTDHINQRPVLFTDIEMDVIRKKAQEVIDNAKNFLKENSRKSGVKVTKSGLQYIVLQEGTGPKPVLEDKIKVNYSGQLTNGEEFENTFKSGNPATFQLKGTVKGFEEGLQLMNVGSKFKLFVPPNLGYGTNERGVIPPNSILIFEVELLEIVKESDIKRIEK